MPTLSVPPTTEKHGAARLKRQPTQTPMRSVTNTCLVQEPFSESHVPAQRRSIDKDGKIKFQEESWRHWVLRPVMQLTNSIPSMEAINGPALNQPDSVLCRQPVLTLFNSETVDSCCFTVIVNFHTEPRWWEALTTEKPGISTSRSSFPGTAGQVIAAILAAHSCRMEQS